MRKSSTGHAGQAIERVLELSADAQITRRKTPKDSPGVPQFDWSDSSLRQSTGDSHSTSKARGILLNSRSI